VTRVERFTRVVGVVVLVAAAITAVLGVVVHGYSVVEMFLFAVALAVSAIPEGSPWGSPSHWVSRADEWLPSASWFAG